jgi:small subunit ribosomal protein S12
LNKTYHRREAHNTSDAAMFALRSALCRLPRIAAGSPLARAAPIMPQVPAFVAPTLPTSPLGRRWATFNQVRNGCRKPQKARKPVSPALSEGKRPCMKGVCVRVSIMKPKKPNSAERKIARVKLSTDRLVTAYIPGEGMWW